jgi:hypothetical protein
MRWCTVTVTDPDGRRHSVDVQAMSTFDAAHLFVVEAKRTRSWPAEANARDSIRGGRRRKDLPCDRRRVAAMDRGKAQLVERPKGIPILPTARLGIMESRRTRLRTP